MKGADRGSARDPSPAPRHGGRYVGPVSEPLLPSGILCWVGKTSQPHSGFSQNQRAAHTPLWARRRARTTRLSTQQH